MNKPTPKPRGRKGGRKPSAFPLFFVKMRAFENERIELNELSTGDARKNFLIFIQALRQERLNHEH